MKLWQDEIDRRGLQVDLKTLSENKLNLYLEHLTWSLDKAPPSVKIQQIASHTKLRESTYDRMPKLKMSESEKEQKMKKELEERQKYEELR